MVEIEKQIETKLVQLLFQPSKNDVFNPIINIVMYIAKPSESCHDRTLFIMHFWSQMIVKSFTFKLHYTLHERQYSKWHNRGTLNYSLTVLCDCHWDSTLLKGNIYKWSIDLYFLFSLKSMVAYIKPIYMILQYLI